MKAQAEYNAMILTHKNYERIKEMRTSSYKGDGNSGTITILAVPKSMIEFFEDKINEMLREEVDKATALVEKMASKYAKAATQ